MALSKTIKFAGLNKIQIPNAKLFNFDCVQVFNEKLPLKSTMIKKKDLLLKSDKKEGAKVGSGIRNFNTCFLPAKMLCS